MIRALQLLYEYRRVLYATSITDIRARYMGTMFGSVWTVLYPFLFLTLYAFVYVAVLQIRLQQYTPLEYVLLIFAGLIPFIGFAESLGPATTAVVSNKSLLKNTMFPVELLPVKAVFTSSVSMIVGLIGILLVLWGRGHFVLTQLLVPLVFAVQIIFSIGLGWLLAALNVFFRDIAQTIGVIVLFLMLFSPIGYTKDMIPASMLPVMKINPLYYLIDLYRSVLIDGIAPVTTFIWFGAGSLALFFLGYTLFMRLKPVFGEYV
jgi:lipopolysaccharide transport system permease protein